MSRLFAQIMVIAFDGHIAKTFVCPNVESAVAAASAGRLNALPILQVIGQLPYQVLEPAGIEVLKMNWAKGLGYA
jgi:hypothetical protein